MCRSIKVLRRPDELATSEELHGAALQFVRKISGFHKPSRINEEAFQRAVADIAEVSRRLLEQIGSNPRKRQVSGVKAVMRDGDGTPCPATGTLGE